MPQPTRALETLIPLLADKDPRRREEAAREIFRQGCAAAEPALGKWFADPEFRGLVGKGNTLLTAGVAVEPPRFAAIRAAAGNPPLAEVPPDQDALEFTMPFGHGVRLDVLTSREPAGEGALARFLRKFGEGIQQVECDLRDVDCATAILRTRFALEPIYPQTRPGADGTRVNFFLVPVAPDRKILIELVEAPRGPAKNK